MIYIIPVSQEHIRSIKDPNNENTRIAHALVSVNDLPLDIPLDPDPRAPKEKGAVPQQIIRSLKTNDGRFHLLNRGITISVKKYTFDTQKQTVSLDIPEEEQYGIIDGGHTYYAISANVQRERERLIAELEEGSSAAEVVAFPEQYVHLEILERIEEHLADIAEARNFSVALKSWTLANYRDKFDWLLTSIGPEYTRHIKVRENDEQPVGILDVIQIMSAVNPILFSEEKPAIESYKNVGKCLEWFVDEEDKYGFRKFEPIAKDILRLYDYVRFNFKEKYNAADESGKPGRFGARKEAKDRKRGSRRISTYYFLEPEKGPVQGDVPIEKGFALPLISGFRVLVKEKKGRFEWLTDPFKFFDTCGTMLVRTIMNASDLAGGDPHLVGRDPQAYRQMTSEVRRWYLEGELAKRNGSKK